MTLTERDGDETSTDHRHHRQLSRGADSGHWLRDALDQASGRQLAPPACFANNTSRIDHLYQDPYETKYMGQPSRLVLHYGDLTDSTNLIRITERVQRDEVYNLGALSHTALRAASRCTQVDYASTATPSMASIAWMS